jgi:hypothetical protein
MPAQPGTRVEKADGAIGVGIRARRAHLEAVNLQMSAADALYISALGAFLAPSRAEPLLPPATARLVERAACERLLAGTEQEFEHWRAGLRMHVQKLWAAFEAHREDLSAHRAFLETLIAAVDLKLASERAENAAVDKNWRRIVKGSKARSKAYATRVGGIARRMSEISAKWHNERVNFYYELLALRAEHDPEARGGPAFDKAEDLVAYLHQAAAGVHFSDLSQQ